MLRHLENKEAECLEVTVDGAENQTFASVADRLESRLRDEAEPVILCGLSLGAVLGLELYFRCPHKISGLILIAPQYKMPALLIGFQNAMFRLIPRIMFSAMGLSKKELISISSSMKHIDYSAKILSIDCPVYVVCGSKDRANTKTALSLYSLLPQVKISFIAKAGHEVNVDTPKELAKCINSAYEEINSDHI